MSSSTELNVSFKVVLPRHPLAAIFVGALASCFLSLTIHIANAQGVINPVGPPVTVNSGSYNNQPFEGYGPGDGDGYYNEGTLTVNPQTGIPGNPQFDNNNNAGLVNLGTTTVSGGSFDDNSQYGLLNSGTLTVTGGSYAGNQNDGINSDSGSASISGGSFDNNTSGIVNSDVGAEMTVSGVSDYDNIYGISNDNGGLLTVSGGTFDQDSAAIASDSNNAVKTNAATYVTGGVFENGQDGIFTQQGATVYLSGGTFINNSEDDLFELFGGTINVYGTSFIYNGVSYTGDLPNSSGSFAWTQANGFTQTMTFDEIPIYSAETGSDAEIDLIQVPPAAAPETSSFASFGLLIAFAGLMPLISRRRPTLDETIAV